MHSYHGSCHCGAIQFSFEGPDIDKGMRCNCSLCKRKGALMTTYTLPLGDIKTQIKADALASYQFGSAVAKHYFCKHCGIYTFHETKRMPGECRINIGCLSGVDVYALPSTVFDGQAL